MTAYLAPKALPLIPKLTFARSSNIQVGSLISSSIDDIPPVERYSTQSVLRAFVKNHPAVSHVDLTRVVPVVESLNDKLYLGCVSMKELRELADDDDAWSRAKGDGALDLTLFCALDRSNPSLSEHVPLARALTSFAIHQSNSVHVTDQHGRLKGILSLASIGMKCDEALL